jgi:predicted LPLAT superfamily acyltransferase
LNPSKQDNQTGIADMTTYTAAQFAQSPAFMAIALEDALKLVAKTNGQTFELACEAFSLQVPNVVNQVAKLVAAACQHCSDEANAGRMWA